MQARNESEIVQPQAPAGPATIQALTQTVDEALGLLRQGRYSDLEATFSRLERQATGLETLKLALQNGAIPEPSLERLCGHLGNSLFVFSQVARQVATVEAGMAQLFAGPRDCSYGRGGQCESAGESRFRQEA
jgi:hypothetical protein